MNKSLIKVGFCIAYDWDLLRYSIPQIYEDADYICLSIDIDRTSWALNSFSFDEIKFRELLSQLDPAGKIHVYEDNFHLPELSPMQNEVRQRNKMAEYMGNGGWHIQLDTDEYFIDFAGFVKYLKSKNFSRPVNICCPLITLFKKVDLGYLWIKNNGFYNQDTIAIATNSPNYQFGRRNGNFNILTNYPIVHQSWARDENEISEKINNWGHATDFDVKKYFEFWKNLTELNYHNICNLHPIDADKWQNISFQKADTIPTLFDVFKEKKPIDFPMLKLWVNNSIWISRAKKLAELILSKKK